MTETISFGNALKAFRRGVHVYGADWKGVVLCQTWQQMHEAVNDAQRIFNGSSLMSTLLRSRNMFVFEPSDAYLQFAVVTNDIDAYALKGRLFTQVIYLFEPSEPVRQIVATLLRPQIVPEDKLRTDYSGL